MDVPKNRGLSIWLMSLVAMIVSLIYLYFYLRISLSGATFAAHQWAYYLASIASCAVLFLAGFKLLWNKRSAFPLSLIALVLVFGKNIFAGLIMFILYLIPTTYGIDHYVMLTLAIYTGVLFKKGKLT